MKKTILAVILAASAFTQALRAGEISQGAVPGSINYQGRLERDNAPVTGKVHLMFKIFNAPTGGTQRWGTPSEVIVDAVQGIFSATITPPWDTFSRAETLYLEVQVESDVLVPREPLSSVAYAMVAKKLEDGASVSVTTLTANYQVLLATDTNSKVGIGTNSPAYKLSVNGSIKLMNKTDGIYFGDGSTMFVSSIGSAGNLSTPGNARIMADIDNQGYGDIIFSTGGPAVELARITNNGRMGIGPAAVTGPLGTLDIDGPLYVGSPGIYDRTGGAININGNVHSTTGRFVGINGEYISVGETLNVVSMVSGGAERMRVHSDGNVGIGLTAPAVMLHSASDIASNTGVRGGLVSIGAYGGSLANEIRGQGSNLLIQQNNYNVGIGTDSPKEKLHVRGNIRAENGGIIAETADFSGNVAVRGDFEAVSGINEVKLSSTIIYGTLEATGGIISSAGGLLAYITADNVFAGHNTFTERVVVSSDIMVGSPVGYAGRLAIGAADFNFPGSKYLQIGDKNLIFNDENALAYIVGGSNADAQLYFYRGADKIAGLETQRLINPTALALTVAGQTKMLVDDVYSRIQNNMVWISTGDGTTPAIFVNSSANVGIGTSNPDNKLTVDGNIRVSGAADPNAGIIFPNGSKMFTAGVGSASGISTNDDAIVQANADNIGGGSVILRSGSADGLIIKSAKVGIGTSNPVSRLNIQNGALVVGNPQGLDSYLTGTNLLVGGELIVDGIIKQLSTSPAEYVALMVSGNVYLSTAGAPGAMTRIGSAAAPAYQLDVTGNINASGNIMTSGNTRISATGAWNGNTITVPYGGTGLTAWTQYGVVYAPNTGSLGQLGPGTGTQVLHGNDGGAPAWGQVSLTADVSGTLPVGNGGTGMTSLTGVLKGNGGSNFSVMTGATDALVKWTSDGTTIGNSIISDNGSTVSVLGNITMNGTGKIINLVDPTANQDAATKLYVDDQTGDTVGKTWNRSGNTISAGNWLGSANAQNLVFKTNNTEQMTITSGGAVQLVNALGVAYGGTGITGGTSGGVPYFSGASAISASAALAQYNVLIGGGADSAPYSLGSVGASGQVLTSAGASANPAWATIPTQTSALLSATHTDTLAASVVRGDLIVGNATPAWSRLAKGTQYQTLQGGATDPAWGAVALNQATAVSGILGSANGGTANGFTAFSGPTTSAKTFTLPDASAAILTTNAAVTVAQGGTGQVTFTSNGVLYGNVAGAVQVTAAGGANTVLRGTGGAPTFGTIDSNYTEGPDLADFEVVVTTTSSLCRTLTVTNGMVTSLSGTHACPN